jgi:hypothetical protein
MRHDVNKDGRGWVSEKKSDSRLVGTKATDDFSKDFNSMREILDGVGIADQRLPASAAKALKGTDIQEMREKRSSIFKVFTFRPQIFEVARSNFALL